MPNRLLVAGVLSLAAAVGVTTPAHAGPPWISIELPANPMNTTTRDAFLLVHTFHHDLALGQVLEGRAEGIVDGHRQTIVLTFTNTSRDFVRGVPKNWPDKGAWVLVITTGSHKDGATALVGIGPDGKVRSIEVPSKKQGRWIVPTPVTQGEVDAMLTEMAATGPVHHRVPNLALVLGGLLILPTGLVLFRRKG